jgi:hypothetical protein
MLVPLLPVPEESASLTNPLRVAEEVQVQPEVTESPLLVVEEDQVKPEDQPVDTITPLLVVEETVPEEEVQVQPEEESPRVAEEEVQVPPTTIVEI